MKIKAIKATCNKCEHEEVTSNFAISAMSNGNAAPILFCQFECSYCGSTSQLERIESTDFDNTTTRVQPCT
jgi:hypothetical protein